MAMHVPNRPRGDLHARAFWWDGLWAGLIAGIAFMILEMFLVWLVQGKSPWGPPHMMAAMLLGRDVLPPTGNYAPFDPGIMMAAMVVHFPLSLFYGVLGAWMVQRLDFGGALIFGALLGGFIYVLHFVIIAPATFPWFGMARGPVGIASHVVFGAVLTGSYVTLRNRHRAKKAPER